ncbi:type IV pili methyl-accepting chemotaxis transducer N-terminal domain-containing protein [Zoogloea sp.]|uniref:type IV pili methyl-accepting chemotaxis transducer N-terminal domain-containing protein n=1 Tax=Zoogloea sp. TaxID=49181 RepID=UPI001D39E4E3|nr:type IV pili methyl-accepting chemotaxis transducer N-terminal domain-containing protein [Zoogloea sp.]MBK6653786.1 type IV pili methyl-accepting chemotaxis transducer N-terminal domain-containing protein [Zoogloea sp.]
MRPYPLLAAALTAVLLAIGGPSPAFALNTSSQEASADLAEQNRMLSQRATKAYLMALQGINPADARDILADSTARLERNLATLRTGKLDEATRSKLTDVDKAWAEVRVQLDAPPSASGALALYDSTEALQRATQHLAMAINANAPEASRRLVLPSRMRALSQRIAMHYLYRASGVLTPNAPEMELTYARGEFAANLYRAGKNDTYTPEAREALNALSRLYPAYHDAAGKLDTPPSMLKNAPTVMTLSEQVLGATEKTVNALLKPANP